MNRAPLVVTEADVPPANHQAGKHTQCGWCTATIGQEHDEDCVCRERSVVARLSFEFVTTVPEAFTPQQLNFHHNGNIFCASNYLDALIANGRDFCICDSRGELGFSYVREASAQDEETLPWAYKWRKGYPR